MSMKKNECFVSNIDLYLCAHCAEFQQTVVMYCNVIKTNDSVTMMTVSTRKQITANQKPTEIPGESAKNLNFCQILVKI